MTDYRMGIGYDIHRLVVGRKLIIGGVEIPHSKGLLGYSDADVLLHAVCDALLGAVGLGDIGEHFPDTDPEYRGIESARLLNHVGTFLREQGFLVHHIDTIIIAEEPNLSGFKQAIRGSIADILGIPAGSVNIKAKTNEGLDATGKKEAIAAYAAVTLYKGV
jgi:2-C-methyl-D-erythritol 2,4-cyclodiphosphate synthase